MSLLSSETIENFKWVFNRFRLFSKREGTVIDLQVIITDEEEDDRMISAISEIFPKSVSQICSWHKFQNFKKHFLNITKLRETKSKEEKENFFFFFSGIFPLTSNHIFF